MKHLFFIALLFVFFSAHAQNVKQDAKGNFIALSAVKDTANDKNTGKTFTDSKGQIWPVYVSKNGKLYALRTSKNGNQYKQYLKTE